MTDIELTERIESETKHYNCLHEEKNNNTLRLFFTSENYVLDHKDVKGITCRPCFSAKLYDQFTFEGINEDVEPNNKNINQQDGLAV